AGGAADDESHFHNPPAMPCDTSQQTRANHHSFRHDGGNTAARRGARPSTLQCKLISRRNPSKRTAEHHLPALVATLWTRVVVVLSIAIAAHGGGMTPLMLCASMHRERPESYTQPVRIVCQPSHASCYRCSATAAADRSR